MKQENTNNNDLLDMVWINSLPQPLFVCRYGNADPWFWPVFDIDVQTGLLRIDVIGLLEVWHFSDVARVRDGCGKDYHSEAFYTDAIPEERESIVKE